MWCVTGNMSKEYFLGFTEVAIKCQQSLSKAFPFFTPKIKIKEQEILFFCITWSMFLVLLTSLFSDYKSNFNYSNAKTFYHIIL